MLERGVRSIHNTSNIIAIDAEIHRKVSAQRAYGIQKLREFGAIP